MRPMMTIERSILETLRTLPPEKQQAMLTHALKLQGDSTLRKARWTAKGLGTNLDVTLTARDMDDNQRQMWKNFPRDDF